MKTLILILAGAVLFAACKKDDKNNTPAATTFDIATPADGSTYAQGQVVQIHATVTSPDTMHGYEAWVINTGNGDTLLRFAKHDHGMSLVLTNGFTNTVTANAVCEFTLQANIDHGGHYLRSAPRKFTLLK